MLNCFFQFFAVWPHLSEGSVDGVKMFVESTVTGNQMKDGSVARLVLNVVVVKLTNDGELIRSNDRVSVSMFVLYKSGILYKSAK